ncbi:MAG: hypothetical protein ACR2RE_24025 [Geminicoccaceae bacterium]
MVDGALYERFLEQQRRWDQAYANGSSNDIETQAGGMIRAYQAATERLEGHRRTAYLIAHDHERGRSLCISTHSESVSYAADGTEYPVTWVTPESVARLVGQAQDMGVTIEDREDRQS